ncbi:MAG: CoA-binding protein [Rhizobiales bacterium]|nr:CoA-binding protein [Hyphomicrobiales bacterium]
MDPPHPGPLPKGEREKGAAASLRRALLAPASVAIVGQSDDAEKTTGRPLKYLRQAGFPGRIYPINPRRETVLGERAWPSLAALPEVPEHVYILTPTEAAIEAAAECGRLGVTVAMILAAGFAEAGAEGEAREARLRAICAETGLRIVGPSSLGVVDLRHKAFLTANAAFDEQDLPVGRIFAASHSGTMIGSLLSRGKARGIHFAGLASVGNEVDLSIGEICQATLDDPGIDGYALFLETLRKADALRVFALAAAARGKPVIAYKLGRSAEARELAVSHTGALAGEDDVAEAFLADCGIARVETLDGLIEGLPLVSRIPIAARHNRRPSVAVVTTTAGGATMVVDPLAVRGIAADPPSAETLARIRTATGIDLAPSRLVDLTVAGARYEVMKAALDILTAAPEFDLVVAVVGSSSRFLPERAVKPIVDSAGAAKPIAAFLAPEAPDALAQLAAAGVPSFRTPEACADAIAAALKRRPPKPMVAMRRAPAGAPGRMLDEAQAYELLDRLGIARAPTVALDTHIKSAPDLPFPYPVAVKVLSAEIAHKSEVGGVVLDVPVGDALPTVIQRLQETVSRRCGIRIDRVLVQPMIAGLGEVLVGYRVDRDAGPLVMLAAGGIHAEIYRDRVLRLAPVDFAEAQAMIGEVWAMRMLEGFRGKPAGDLEALARTIVKFSQLAALDNPVVAEAEINPLIVHRKGEGVTAVDALVRIL